MDVKRVRWPSSTGSEQMKVDVKQITPLAVLVCVVLALPVRLNAQLDESWTVTVNGQSAQVSSDGSYRISNVSSPDRDPRDLLSDDFFRVRGFSTAGGVTRYVYSDRFQIRRGETYVVESLTVTTSRRASLGCSSPGGIGWSSLRKLSR